MGGEAWLQETELVAQFHVRGTKERYNFQAKYLNGNSQLNIRSLNNKVVEIKNIVKEYSPNILGLSECELRKVNGYYDETKLKVPGYNTLFPKSWTTSGSARAIVYVKNNFEYEQVHDLEDDKVQSILLEGGFKNGKRIFFCHGYREHTSCLGNTTNDQRSNLSFSVGSFN